VWGTTGSCWPRELGARKAAGLPCRELQNFSFPRPEVSESALGTKSAIEEVLLRSFPRGHLLRESTAWGTAVVHSGRSSWPAKPWFTPEVACGVVPVPNPEKDRPSNPALQRTPGAVSGIMVLRSESLRGALGSLRQGAR